MRLLTFMMVGAAVAYGINYVTRKNEDGTSIIDDLAQKAPDWMEKGKQYATQTIDRVTDTIDQHNIGRY